MSQQSSALELPLRVTGPDGTILWQGVGSLGTVRSIKNTTTTDIADANHVILDNTATTGAVIVANDLAQSAIPATGMPLFVLGGARGSTTPPSSLGFALGAIKAGTVGLTASVGSICFASTASSTGTLGRFVLGAASGNVTDSATPPSVPTVSPGRTLRPSGTTTGAQFGITDTGTATRMAVLCTVGSIT
jgi:hypothetical protein